MCSISIMGVVYFSDEHARLGSQRKQSMQSTGALHMQQQLLCDPLILASVELLPSHQHVVIH
jgi:hypothetical protein